MSTQPDETPDPEVNIPDDGDQEQDNGDTDQR
jgi:hypothetical protein